MEKMARKGEEGASANAFRTQLSSVGGIAVPSESFMRFAPIGESFLFAWNTLHFYDGSKVTCRVLRRGPLRSPCVLREAEREHRPCQYSPDGMPGGGRCGNEARNSLPQSTQLNDISGNVLREAR